MLIKTTFNVIILKIRLIYKKNILKDSLIYILMINFKFINITVLVCVYIFVTFFK